MLYWTLEFIFKLESLFHELISLKGKSFLVELIGASPKQCFITVTAYYNIYRQFLSYKEMPGD